MSIVKTTVPCKREGLLLREDFDGWCELADGGTSERYSLNPTGALVWGEIDGQRSVEEILDGFRKGYKDFPDEGEMQVVKLLEEFDRMGLILLTQESIGEGA